MFNGVGRAVALFFFLLLGAGGAWYYATFTATDRKIAKLEEEKKELERIVVRISAEWRVADVLVLDQKQVDGVVETALLFLEYRRDGSALPPKRLVVRGEEVHVDALVITFEQGYIEKGDPLRGRSIALFTRVYGDRQSPADGPKIDEPGRIPDIYRGAGEAVTAFETELWKDFWRLADDKEYAAKKGVRLVGGASGKGAWRPVKADQKYTITLSSTGSLSISSEEIPGIYREAMKVRATER